MNESLIPNIELFLTQVTPFNYLPEEMITQIAHHIEISYYPKGQQIILEKAGQTALFIIRVGAIEQRYQDNSLRARLENGEVFGFSLFNQQEEEKYEAIALENTLLYQVPNHYLSTLLAEYPHYAPYFSDQVATRLMNASSKQILSHQQSTLMKEVGEIANRKVAFVDPNHSIREAALVMTNQRRSSALIMQEGRLVGIVNDRDMTKKVVANGRNINEPVTSIMTENPPTIAASERVLNAIVLMMKNNLRNLPVLDGDEIVAVLSATDLVSNNSVQSIFIINRIFQAKTLEALVELKKMRDEIFITLIENEVSYDQIMQVMSLIADSFMQKLIMMGENQLGTPPCHYAWCVAGSQAREEMHVVSDQDNFIILSRELNDQERDYFSQLTQFVNDSLDKCGYEKCSGDFMASNPKWCQSLPVWEAYFADWIMHPELEKLLNASVFLDRRVIFGDESLLHKLDNQVIERIKNNHRFISYLVANSIRVKAPISIFKNFVLIKEGENKNKLNLKKRAISLLVDLARIYALVGNCERTLNTKERFKYSVEQGVIDKNTYDDISAAYQFVCSLRLKYQLNDIKQNRTLSNHIDPKSLNAFERNNLKDVFRLINQLQQAAEMRFSQKGLMR